MKRSLGSRESKEAADRGENPSVVLDIQEAMANMAAVFYCLSHMDPTQQVIQQLLIHYN